MDVRDDVLAAAHDRRVGRGAERGVEHGAALGRLQTHAVCQRHPWESRRGGDSACAYVHDLAGLDRGHLVGDVLLLEQRGQQRHRLRRHLLAGDVHGDAVVLGEERGAARLVSHHVAQV